jgi:hypothetical protein
MHAPTRPEVGRSLSSPSSRDSKLERTWRSDFIRMGFMEKRNHRGRPRIYSSGASRQKAYRKRKKAAGPPTNADPHAWNKFLAKLKLSVNYDRFIQDASEGRGLMHCGGFSTAILDWLLFKQSNQGPCGGGRKSHPTGAGPSDGDSEPTGYSKKSPDFGQIVQWEIEMMDREEAKRRERYENQHSETPAAAVTNSNSVSYTAST